MGILLTMDFFETVSSTLNTGCGLLYQLAFKLLVTEINFAIVSKMQID